MKLRNSKFSADYKSIFTLCFSVLAVFFVMWTFTGKWPWVEHPYNSFMLQAQAWLDGRLSLPQNYVHLELAVFNEQYYVSFPPFPSYVMVPFLLLGITKCEGLITLISAMAAAVYAFKICEHFDIKQERAILFSLLLTIGSNWLFTVHTSWVWFIAQNLAFTLSLMSIYYALRGNGGLALACWACAVGSRPFQILYLPVLLYLLYDKDATLTQNIKAKWKALIPMVIIALSYMILNFARFGNPFEFGHNYLPEFTRTEEGQFATTYIAQNIKTLFRLPKISFDGKWEYPGFDGMNIFITSPIFISYIAYTVYAFVKKKADRKLIIGIFLIIIIHLLCLTAHKTMGGSQFGNRYTNDVLPFAFLGIASSMPKSSGYEKLNIVLLLFGFVLNITGSVIYFMG